MVEGARCIGKSTIVEEFAKQEYESYVQQMKAAEEQQVMESQEDLYTMELRGKDLNDLTKQFSRKLSEKMVVNPNGSFDVRA
jgi:hypothetical protein